MTNFDKANSVPSNGVEESGNAVFVAFKCFSTVKVHAIKRWLNKSVQTPAGFLIVKCSSMVWTHSVGRLAMAQLLGMCGRRLGMTRLWLCWAPAPWGAAPRRASVQCCTGGSRGAETCFCICYANNTSFSCTPSAVFLLKSARWGNRLLAGLEMEVSSVNCANEMSLKCCEQGT